jgi:hypothetical protein
MVRGNRPIEQFPLTVQRTSLVIEFPRLPLTLRGTYPVTELQRFPLSSYPAMFSTSACPNSLHLSRVAPSIRRWKS